MNENRSLQEKIDVLETFETLLIDFDEYLGPVVIDKPLIIDGRGSTLCATFGPVLTIDSQRVRIKNFRIEVTSPPEEEKGLKSLALLVGEGIRVELENIIVKGNVRGLINEDGVWNYPDVLNLWPVVPHRKNCFAFEMTVPVSCVLETDIAGLRIINPGLSPGPNTVHIEVDGLKEEMILFGEIDIRSTYLKRLISISGGTFGVPPNTPVPDRAHPLFIGGKKGERAKKIDSSKKPGIYPLIAGLILIFLLIAAGLYLFIEKKRPVPPTVSPTTTTLPPAVQTDTERPRISVSGLKLSYMPGQSIDFSIHLQDNQSLETLLFKVKDKPVEKHWQIYGTSEDIQHSVSAEGWAPGNYPYFLKVTDAAGNADTSEGQIHIAPPPAIAPPEETPSLSIEPPEVSPPPAENHPPSGSIQNIKENYIIGETVDYQIIAEDDEDLNRVIFFVEDSDVRKSWEISGRTARFQSSFSTDGWNPGVYSYHLMLEDGANNTSEYTGNFILKGVSYGHVNIFTSPWATVYIDGKDIGSTPLANLKLKAGNVRIRFVNKDYGIDETRTVTVAPDRLTPISFRWNK